MITIEWPNTNDVTTATLNMKLQLNGDIYSSGTTELKFSIINSKEITDLSIFLDKMELMDYQEPLVISNMNNENEQVRFDQPLWLELAHCLRDFHLSQELGFVPDN